MGKKKLRFRKPVREYIDADYIKKLNPEEKTWLKKFLLEYYNNEHNEDGSLHRTILKDRYSKVVNEDKKTVRQEMWAKTNRENNDLYSIKFCSGKTKEFNEYIESNQLFNEDMSSLDYQLKIKEISEIYQEMIEQVLEKLEVEATEKSIEVLQNLISKSIRLFNKHKKIIKKEKKK